MIGGFSLFIGLLTVGLPIAFALIAVAVLIAWLTDAPVLYQAFHQQMFGGLENYGLLALPLFMLVGELLGQSGMAQRLVAIADRALSRLDGGLAYVNLLANAMMAAILGSAAAQISMMNRILTPEMVKAGYRKDFSVALSTAGGLLAPILPPSMVFVVYGVLAQLSIGDMFIAGIVPGLLLCLGFALTIYLYGRVKPYPRQRSHPPHSKTSVPEIAAVLSVPTLIVCAIVFGVATPTEAAALACVLTALIGRFGFKSLTLSGLGDAFIRAAFSSGVILMLIAAAQLLAFVLTYAQIPQMLADWLVATAGSPLAFLLMLNLILLFVGMILDAMAALIIVVPLLLPVATANYGIDPFHFGVVVCLNLALGLVTPPVGSGLFIASSTSGVSPEAITKSLWPFIVVTLLVLLAMTAFPILTRLFL